MADKKETTVEPRPGKTSTPKTKAVSKVDATEDEMIREDITVQLINVEPILEEDPLTGRLVNPYFTINEDGVLSTPVWCTATNEDGLVFRFWLDHLTFRARLDVPAQVLHDGLYKLRDCAFYGSGDSIPYTNENNKKVEYTLPEDRVYAGRPAMCLDSTV